MPGKPKTQQYRGPPPNTVRLKVTRRCFIWNAAVPKIESKIMVGLADKNPMAGIAGYHDLH